MTRWLLRKELNLSVPFLNADGEGYSRNYRGWGHRETGEDGRLSDVEKFKNLEGDHDAAWRVQY